MRLTTFLWAVNSLKLTKRKRVNLSWHWEPLMSECAIILLVSQILFLEIDVLVDIK